MGDPGQFRSLIRDTSTFERPAASMSPLTRAERASTSTRGLRNQWNGYMIFALDRLHGIEQLQCEVQTCAHSERVGTGWDRVGTGWGPGGNLVGTRRGLSGNRVGTKWEPSGNQVVPTRFPLSPHLVVPTSHTVPTWSPTSSNLAPTWFPPCSHPVPTGEPSGNQVGIGKTHKT